MAMASAIPWAAPAACFNRSPRRPPLLSVAERRDFLNNFVIQSSLSSRRSFPPLCKIVRLGSGSWSRRLGFQSLDWDKGEKLSFSVAANTNLNAESFDTAEDEVALFPFHVRGVDGGEVRREIGRDELEGEDSESDDEEDGIYYDEDEDEDEDDRFVDIDAELRDNEEDAEAGVVDLVTLEGSGKSGKDRERLQELCARVMASGERTVTAGDIANLYDFPFDKFQRMSIEGFLKGSSLVVCAPTSSGKTLVAEAAAAATIARGKRLFYTTPLKALSNQKLRDFRELFGEENVGLLTGDAAVNRDAPILIMTTEILRNMLYQSVGSSMEDGGRLMNVDVVVLDEVHYLSDISRGTVWEETVIYCPKEVQLICLSATISNPEELAGWIAQVHGPTELVTSSRRPVPLVWHFSTRHSLRPLLNEQGDEMNWRLNLRKTERERDPDPFWDEMSESPRRKQRKLLRAGKSSKETGKRSESRRRSGGGWGEMEEQMSDEEVQFLRRRQVPQIRDTLHQLKERDMLPAIWFIFSRRGCDLAVHYLLGTDLLTLEEQRRVKKALGDFREQYPDSVREVAVKPLLHGVAAHHAGCLPTWKAFIEDLFQQGLIKVVFATETLAAGINMPARTTVLASLSKRGDNGHQLLSANSMLQMAGRAGRRGIDEQGHTVVVQTPFEGAEDCCKLLFAGSDPLVSQFTATYGMALNLLAGARVKTTAESGASELIRVGRSLDEARALIEKSFGNYVGSEVMVASKQALARLQKEIEHLQKECEKNEDGLEGRLTRGELQEFLHLKESAKEAKRLVREQRKKVESLRVGIVQPLLDAPTNGKPPFICLSFYEHRTGEERLVPALFVGYVPRPPFVTDLINLTSEKGQSEELDKNQDEESSSEDEGDSDVRHYVALGSDNSWYMFTAKSVKSVHKNLANFGTSAPGEKPVEELLKEKLQVGIRKWENLGRSGSGTLSCVWSADSSIDTWAWGCQVPVLSELSSAHEVSIDLVKAERVLLDLRKEASKLRKKLKGSQGYRESRRLLDLQRARWDKLQRTKAKANRIDNRISKMQPSGWKEFLQVVKVLQEAGALKPETNELQPLGEVAAAARGVNELWLAIVFTSGVLNSLAPAQLAAACACLVSDGMKSRSKEGSTSSIYDASDAVNEWTEAMEELRSWLLSMQTKNGVAIPVEINPEFAGLVEAWAAGVTWKELMDDSEMDEGDVARLLRRSIDLLAQIPHLPHVDPSLASTAREASKVMDRPPISELIG
ncbi:hypothetical protein M758_4G093800 [Ceratodon purpureus]|uniref:Uncharacterized protein n=1 Tax=Ceratodon purpureus TaxID=3225 RepID=A0A8T0I8H8_CERPU|nr:hypothetical protein KC19_4G093100 [Ceratodon purpureus]KAG0618820.1 hypothetical protein M758_4G093800 [Ceratodon purpureus]